LFASVGDGGPSGWMMLRVVAGSPKYPSKSARSDWIVSLPYASMITIVLPLPSSPLSRSDWKPYAFRTWSGP
jgi:hypothetical protein